MTDGPEEPGSAPQGSSWLRRVRSALAGIGLSRESLGIVLIAGLGIAAFLLLHGAEGPAFNADPAVPRAKLRVVDRLDGPPLGPCPSCAVISQWIDRLEAIDAEAARRQRTASARFSRAQRAAAARFARGEPDPVTRAGDHRIAAQALMVAFDRAKADCGQSLLCHSRVRGLDDGSGCPPEARPLNAEAARVRRLSRRIETLVSPCLAHACPKVSCGPAHALDARLRVAEETLASLITLPADQEEAQRDLLASPLGTETRRLVRSALRVPLAVPALFETANLSRTASQDGPSPILGLADEVAKLGHWADSLAERLDAVGLQATGPSSGLWRIRLLSARLWRLYDSTRLIASARARGPDTRAAALSEAWSGFAGVLAALALDALRMEGEMDARPSADGNDLLAACRSRQEGPNRTMTRSLALSRLRLRRCMERSACPSEAPAAWSSAWSVGGQTRGGMGFEGAARLPFLEQLAALDHDLAEAARAVGSVAVAVPTAMTPVSLATDRRRYSPGEAMRVTARLDGLACMAEPGAQAAVLGPARPPADLESIRSLRLVEGARLPLSAAKADELWIAAPIQPGRYAVKTFAPAERGGFETAATEFEVAASGTACQGFAGRWETDFGVLHVAIRDGAVRGSYRRARANQPGFLFGTVRDGVLRGHWRSELGEGGTRLELSPDGRSFSGTWSHLRDRVAGTGTWSGRCTPTLRPSTSG